MLRGKFKHQIGTTANEWDDDELDSKWLRCINLNYEILPWLWWKLAKMYRACVKKGCILRRWLEFSKKKETTLLGGNSALNPVGLMISFKTRALFLQTEPPHMQF